MQQVAGRGGRVMVIYTTDGGGAHPPGSSERQQRVEQRNLEAITALAMAGVARADVHFLGHQSGPDFLKPTTAKKVHAVLTQSLVAFQPETVVISAFEGGQLEHDVTNFLVARAAQTTGFPRERILEAPQYNRFYLCEPVFWRLRRIFGHSFDWPPRFPSVNEMNDTLEMNSDELATKRRMLECFVTQRHVRLVERFAFPDRYRPLPTHEYTAGPFEPAQSLRYRVNRLYQGTRAFPFDRPGFGVAECRTLFHELGTGLSSES